MSNKTILLILISLLVLSCVNNSNNKETFKSFPLNLELKGENTGFKPVFSLAKLDIYDSLLLISGTKRRKNTIHLYDKNTYKHILSTGKIGRGPKEIKNPGFYKFNRKQGTLLTPDWGNGKILKWCIDSLLIKKEDYWPKIVYSCPTNIWPIKTFSLLNDSILLYGVDNPKYVPIRDLTIRSLHLMEHLRF